MSSETSTFRADNARTNEQAHQANCNQSATPQTLDNKTSSHR